MKKLIKNPKIIDIIEKSKIFAVVRTDNPQKALEISNALIAGGIKVIEITMGYEGDIDVMRELSQNPEVSVAAGSVITAQQAESAINAGVKLIVSPVCEMRLIKLCRGRRIPIVTGAATPSEAYNAWKLGVDIIKIFPAKALGGPDYIKHILTPMPFLHLMPTGGVDINNFVDYLKAGAVAVGIGQAFYGDQENISQITEKAETAVCRLKDFIQNQ